MRKIFCAVCILFSATFFLSAEQDNGKLFPSREHYSIENFFYGFSGIFDLPNTFYNDNASAMTGVGGGFSAEIGYNWSGWMLSAEYLRDIWATKNAAFVRLEKSRNNIFQLRIRRVLSNKTISKFPEWFSLVPGFGAGVNFMQGNYYATQLDKDLGNYKQITFQDREGHSFAMRFSVEAAFDIFKNSQFIPFVGVDYNIVFNERISGGISGYPRVFLGFRRYPFKNSDKLQRFKKLLEYDQINVTEEPPLEPHLRAIDDDSRVFVMGPGDGYAGERIDGQRSDDEDSLLEDDSNEDLYIGKEKYAEDINDDVSDDNNADDDTDNEDKDQDVYYDDSDKKEDYYLPKDDDDNIDNELADGMSGDDGMAGEGTSDDSMAGAETGDDIGDGIASSRTGDGTGDDMTGEGTSDDSMASAETGDDIRDDIASSRTGDGTGDDMAGGGTNDAEDGIDNIVGGGVIGAVAIGEMPTLKVSTSLTEGFTPDGDGIDDTVDFMFEATGLEYPPESWSVQIVDDAGNVVKSWSGTGDMPERITWDGITDNGKLVDSDREYSAIISAIPDARDAGRTGIGAVTETSTIRTGNLSGMMGNDDIASSMIGDGTGDDMTGDVTSDAEDGIDNIVDSAGDSAIGTIAIGEMPTLKVSTSLADGFTPDGNGIDDTVDFMFEATGLEYPPESWSVQIVDDAGNVVKSWSDNNDNVPEKITWNGITDSGDIVLSNTDYNVIISAVPDERDIARTGITAVTESSSFRTGNLNDNVLPDVRLLMSYSDGLSPDGDGNKDTVDFTFKTHGLEYVPESWKLEILDPVGNIIREWSGKGDLPASITWDGTTDDGDIVAALSNYSVILSVTPDMRDRRQLESDTLVDRQTMRTGIITIDETGMQTGELPEENQPTDETQTVEETTEPETDKQLSGDKTDITPSVSDDQPTDEKPVAEMTEPETDKQLSGDTTDTTPSVSDNQPTDEKPVAEMTEPETDKQLSGDTTDTTPSVSDNQPTDEKSVEDKTVTTSPVTNEDAATKDEANQDETETSKTGKNRRQWRLISVPVYFDPDGATFNIISEENRQSNISVLNKIAAEIKKYGNSAEVIIEGHANNVSNTERENIEELIPLSQKRAEVVRQLLIERGIAADHLTAEGVGGVEPHAEWDDRKNWWKNRRVEFIISVEE